MKTIYKFIFIASIAIPILIYGLLFLLFGGAVHARACKNAVG